MRGIVALAVTAVLASGADHPAAASEKTTRVVTAHAEVAARTSLTVSSEVVQFSVTKPGQPATATIDFVAGVRTRAGAEVVLTVEAATLDGDARITLAGDGDATLHGAMMAARPSVAARWVGSGRRTGRLTFALHAAAPGTYTVAMRVVLSAP